MPNSLQECRAFETGWRDKLHGTNNRHNYDDKLVIKYDEGYNLAGKAQEKKQ